MSKNLKILLALVIIIVLTAGGWFFYQRALPKLFKPQKGILEQIQEQEESQDFAQETRLLIGKITANEGSSIIIRANLPSQNANLAQIPTQRKIIIGDKTRLNKVISLPKGKKDGQMIYDTTMVSIKPQDLKIGDTVEIYANEDIKYKEEITPFEIRVP